MIEKKYCVVLMSTYNGEEYLKEQIESILAQKSVFGKIDLIIRDDGSNDRTQEILNEYSKLGKLKWYTGENLGPARSFIDLVKNCKGYEYYAFADQDDFWLPHKIEEGIKNISEFSKPALYFANAELVDSKLVSMNKNVYRDEPKLDFYTLMCSGGLLGCTMIFNKTLAKFIQDYKQPQKLVMHDFYVAALCSAVGGVIKYDNNIVLKYRQHENNVVGVSYGVLNTIKFRIKEITSKPKNSISDQAKILLELYSIQIESDKVKWLKRVADYKNSLKNRIRLAFSLKTKYININMSIKLRLSILLGNR